MKMGVYMVNFKEHVGLMFYWQFWLSHRNSTLHKVLLELTIEQNSLASIAIATKLCMSKYLELISLSEDKDREYNSQFLESYTGTCTALQFVYKPIMK